MIPQNGNSYMDNMFDMSEESMHPKEPSEIAQFFAGCNVLITGGSGFLGKLLIEKLLRCCPDISTLFILMRTKKGKSPEERFKEHFEDVVYDRLKAEQKRFFHKVVMIEGNTEDEDLGLSPESRNRILSTNVILHAAATVRFDEKLRIATNINVRGTKQLLLLAKQMPNIKAFVHISTAFSYCVHQTIEEKHYKPPLDTDSLLTLVDAMDDEKLEQITPILIGKWPNTYVFTKAIAEEAVLKYSVGIPTCIVRPSIIISTSKEPIAGWINNLYGPTGVVIGAAIGLMRTLHCKPEKVADIIPADYVISNIIAAAWSTATSTDTSASTESEHDKAISDIERVSVYNCVSSCQQPISWGRFLKLNERYGMQVPSTKVLWQYCFLLNRYLFIHNLCVVFLHLIPGAIVDALAYLTGRQPMLLKAYKKIHKFSHVISYFSLQEWKFSNDTVMKLWNKLNPTDREIFNFNLDNLDWNEYFYYHIRGLRVYLVKDPLDTIDEGRSKVFKLKIIHYTLITLLWLLLLWGIVVLISSIWLRYVY